MLTPSPPDPPELPAGAERPPAWPAWFALAGFLIGLAGTVLFGIVLGLFAALLGADLDAGESSPALVVVGTLAQGVAFALTAVFLAGRVAKPRRWHFGLRATSFWPALGWAALGVVSFYVVSAVYGAVVSPDAEQDTVQQLGGDQGTLGLFVAGVMVVVVAPVVEEFFFRGFFYRALRSRFSVIVAALLDGLLFGLIHFGFDGADGLLILPPLAVLGFIYCLVYERTGSLYPVIAMHALNNAIAYAVLADGGWRVSVIAFPLVVAACVLVPRRASDGPRAPRLAGA
ncbi:hypothetical protein BH20ACT19_BH20ACT19_14710 [soil metagenome]